MGHVSHMKVLYSLSLISISLDFVVSSVAQTLDWEADESFRSSSDMRRNQSASDFRASGGRGAPAKSSEDIYSRSQLEASAVNKESFFAKRMAENKSKPEGLPPLLCLRDLEDCLLLPHQLRMLFRQEPWSSLPRSKKVV
ncbi:ADP-ribosylation factor GTPase-activating protein AGD7-like [Brassica napus]|uniref:ADP-ribosylation factor GTPase-activating protein AGD7-like n=1 Tax=Brassica napus TaxID=3708 RepID=UPI00207A9ADA|nr:ADP-ribosylation factor GTPase-activating protein AGD7-like [Brassica napus]